MEADYATPGHNEGMAARVAVGMFVIEHPKGLVLVDTGNHPRVAEDATAYWGKDVAAAIQPEMAPDEAVDKHLIRLGYKLEEIKHVILTHMHLDHAGGMSLFPHATFYIQKDELAAAMWPDPRFAIGHYEIKDFAKTRNYDIKKLDGDLDLFGDGRISIIKTGGHSVGHQMVLLKLREFGPTLLPGDACMMPEQLELLTPPGMPIPEPEKGLAVMKQIREKVEKEDLYIAYSHPTNKDWVKACSSYMC
jgi:glyoxylase-like metal-dependent hydrolase (beta-lactamase superfamily II)